MRNARRNARARVGQIEAARDAAVVEAFRIELGAVVRSASPLLVPMLAAAGRTLDEMAERIEPPLGWPRRPRLSGHKDAYRLGAHAFRHFLAASYLKGVTSQSLASCEIRRADGDYIVVQAVQHSLELVARIGQIRLETRFGELRVEPLDKLPETIFAASVGRLLEEIVDHAAWRGRGWRIAAIEEDGGQARTDACRDDRVSRVTHALVALACRSFPENDGIERSQWLSRNSSYTRIWEGPHRPEWQKLVVRRRFSIMRERRKLT